MRKILTIIASENAVIRVEDNTLTDKATPCYSVAIECPYCGKDSVIFIATDMFIAVAAALETYDLVTGSDVCHNCLGIRETPNGKLGEWN